MVGSHLGTSLARTSSANYTEPTHARLLSYCHAAALAALLFCRSSLGVSPSKSTFVFFKEAFQRMFSCSQSVPDSLSSSHLRSLIEHLLYNTY